MVRSAPTIDPRLLRLARRLDRRERPFAETVRDVGAYAARIGLVRPSYEQVRVHLHESRLRRKRRRDAIQLLVDVDLRARPPHDLLHLLDDGPVPPPRARRRV